MNSYEQIIKSNAQEYYTTGNQSLSDEVFDAVVDKVKETNPNSKVLKTGWGFEINESDKVKHKYCKIGSLDKVKTIEDLKNKMKGSDYVCIAAKLDGLSCVLYYNNGILVKAITRGDGEYGVDVTEKVKNLKNGENLIDIDEPFTGAIRGEIFMTPDDFSEYNKVYPEAANARNSAAGIINSKDITKDLNYLSLYVYTVVADENNYCSSFEFTYTFLRKHFAFVVPYYYISFKDVTEDKLIELKTKFEQSVVIDGLVITNNNISMNYETRTFNYNQIAYKFQDEIKIATVKHIEWTASKHNVYVPVVVFKEPIELEGTQVKRATGYNAKWILDMGIKANSIVAVRKSNKIIPQIIEIIK